MTYLSISLLGPFQAWTSNGAPQTFRTLKERALLAYLAVEHRQPQRREMLAELFWPDRSEGTARNNLRQALYGIRQVIGEPGFDAVFHITSSEVQMNMVDQVWSDLAAYEVHYKAWRSHNHGREACPYCLRHLRDAVEYYRGSFLQDIALEKNQAFEEWLSYRRTQYFNMQVQSLEMLVSTYEQMGDYVQAAVYAQRLAQMDEMNEALYQRLMALLGRTGQFSAALEQFDRYRSRLRSRTGADPSPELVQLAEKIRQGRFETDVEEVREIPHHLPEQLVPFVGREMELSYIERYLGDPSCRLLTITGPGGVGKTRLAIQVGQLQLQAFPHGVFFVPLDAVKSPSQLAERINEAIGLTPGGPEETQKTLLEYLRLKHILLILDGFEQFLEGRPLVMEILQNAPFVKMMVTSRERLNYQAEFLVELDGLSYPEESAGERSAGRAGPGEMRSFAALQLFLERVRRVYPLQAGSNQAPGGLAENLTPQEMEAAVRICRLVDGLPLGIELAASWARDFPIHQIADEVQRSLEFLQTSLQDLPERHRSLRASFEHSWELLTESEREVFCKLAVFPGSFSSEAAQAIAGAALPWLVRLEDKSLLRRAAPGRYQLHALIRQFAGLKLRQYSRKVEDHAHRQHAEYFSEFLSAREGQLKGLHQAAALSEIATELENIRVAWEWARQNNAVDILYPAAYSLMLFFEMRSRWHEGEAIFGRAVVGLRGAEKAQPGALRAQALFLACQGWFCCRLTRFEQAQALIEQSLSLLDGDLQNPVGVFAQFALGFSSVWMGRFPQALEALSRSQALAAQQGDDWAQAWSHQVLIEIAFESGQLGFQEEPFLRALAMFERLGELRGSSRALNYLGNIAMTQEHFESARVYYETMLANLEMLGDVWGSAGGYSKLGQLAAARGDFEQAWNLHQRGLGLVRRTGDQRRTGYALGALAEAGLTLGRQAEAHQALREALEIASVTHNAALALEVLTSLAAALLRTSQAQQASRLLRAILAAAPGDPLTASRATRLLESTAPGEPVQTHGRSGSVWQLVEEILQDGLNEL